MMLILKNNKAKIYVMTQKSGFKKCNHVLKIRVKKSHKQDLKMDKYMISWTNCKNILKGKLKLKNLHLIRKEQNS